MTKPLFLLLFMPLTLPFVSSVGSTPTNERDKALSEVVACRNATRAFSPECKHFDENVKTLKRIYAEGDKSVMLTLMTLANQANVAEFFRESLVADTTDFFTALLNLPVSSQRQVELRIAGARFGVENRVQFQSLRNTLTGVSTSSPAYQLARDCLKILDSQNAYFLVAYFPSDAFAGRENEYQVRLTSNIMYSMGLDPLWPPHDKTERIYRAVLMPSFAPDQSVTLRVMPDGTALIRYVRCGLAPQYQSADETSIVGAQKVSGFMNAFGRPDFAPVPKNDKLIDLDGSWWLLEMVQNGEYKTTHRWCPGKSSFGDAVRSLFKLAGRKPLGDC